MHVNYICMPKHSNTSQLLSDSLTPPSSKLKILYFLPPFSLCTPQKKQTPHNPIPSMGLVCLPTFTMKIKHSWIGKYTVRPMDPWWVKHSSQKNFLAPALPNWNAKRSAHLANSPRYITTSCRAKKLRQYPTYRQHIMDKKVLLCPVCCVKMWWIWQF